MESELNPKEVDNKIIFGTDETSKILAKNKLFINGNPVNENHLKSGFYVDKATTCLSIFINMNFQNMTNEKINYCLTVNNRTIKGHITLISGKYILRLGNFFVPTFPCRLELVLNWNETVIDTIKVDVRKA
jgi:hypothetical protein